MRDTHLTLRLPLDLARALARRARARGVPKSQLVREAVARYLGGSPAPGSAVPLTARELAARWPSLPRLTPEEADRFGSDIDAGRAALPAIRAAWEE